VLADGVVVEFEARRQGGHVNRAGGVGDGAEDGVAGGIAERLGLALHPLLPLVAHTRPTLRFL